MKILLWKALVYWYHKASRVEHSIGLRFGLTFLRVFHKLFVYWPLILSFKIDPTDTSKWTKDRWKMKPAMISNRTFKDMEVCVPSDWIDEQVEEFANSSSPYRIQGVWKIRKEGSEYLQGAQERQPCVERKGFVHIMLDA